MGARGKQRKGLESHIARRKNKEKLFFGSQ